MLNPLHLGNRLRMYKVYSSYEYNKGGQRHKVHKVQTKISKYIILYGNVLYSKTDACLKNTPLCILATR